MGKGQQQRILFGFWIMGLAHKQCRGELELLQLLLYCQDVCVRILCYPFLDCPCLFKETMELLNVCRKMIFQLLCLYICELWIAMFFFFFLFEYPWWRKALNILVCSRVRWPSYCSLVCVSLLQGLGFSFPLLFSAANLVIEQEASQCQTLDKKPGLKVKSGDNL